MKLPIVPSDEAMALVTKTKYMLAHAVEHSSRSTDFDNMMAVLGFDSTVEYILRGLVIHLDLESLTHRPYDSFDLGSLVQDVNRGLKEAYDSSLPYAAEIKLLRQTRNLVQHGAVAPNADIVRFRKIAERLFEKVAREFYGFDSAELRLSALITNTETKRLLVQAERHLDSKEWIESVVASRDAFESAYFDMTRGSNISLSLYPTLLDSVGTDEIQGWGFRTILDELESTRLGINNREYRKFRDYLQHIPSEYRPEDAQSHTVIQRDWNSEDALFCYSFVANALLRWQTNPDVRLYEVSMEDKYEFEQVIDGFTYNDANCASGCTYLFGKTWVELFYANKDAKHSLETLQINREYQCITRRYRNGTKDFERVVQRTLLNVHSFLIRSNPECWGVIVKYREETP